MSGSISVDDELRAAPATCIPTKVKEASEQRSEDGLRGSPTASRPTQATMAMPKARATARMRIMPRGCGLAAGAIASYGNAIPGGPTSLPSQWRRHGQGGLDIEQSITPAHPDASLHLLLFLDFLSPIRIIRRRAQSRGVCRRTCSHHLRLRYFRERLVDPTKQGFKTLGRTNGDPLKNPAVGRVTCSLNPLSLRPTIGPPKMFNDARSLTALRESQLSQKLQPQLQVLRQGRHQREEVRKPRTLSCMYLMHP